MTSLGSPAPAADDPHAGHAHGASPFSKGPAGEGTGKALPPSSGFSDDDGSADPALTSVLADFSAGTA
ncbi:hypothetical protein DLJ96_01245, partial [Actinotalea fermentans ATCC 43279 = JCM 9966 = DSM 3133]